MPNCHLHLTRQMAGASVWNFHAGPLSDGQTLIAELKRARSKSEASLRIPDMCRQMRFPPHLQWKLHPLVSGCSMNRTLLQCPTLGCSHPCICIYIYIYAYLSVQTCNPFIPIIAPKDQNIPMCILLQIRACKHLEGFFPVLTIFLENKTPRASSKYQ